MPKIEGNQIPQEVKGTSDLTRALTELGLTKDPRQNTLHFTTRTKGDVFVTSEPDKKGILHVVSVIFPSRVVNELGRVLNLPFSTSDRQPEEEGA